jgi:hypothetical protein
MGFFWSRAPPAITQEYQETVAHRVRDILTGVDHSSHEYRNKQAIKALQRPEALAGVIEILKSMPEPCPKADGWHLEEGADLDTNSDDNSVEENVGSGEKIAEAFVTFATTAAAVEPPTAQKKDKDNDNQQHSRPDGPTVMAATTIAAAAATSAVAATLAVTLGRKKGAAIHEQLEETQETAAVGPNGTVTKTTVTLVRFRPSKDTVSSHAYWWGYEIFIPQDALSRIGSAQDVSSAFLGFLGSVGLVVPAIVPFLGYIAAYVGLEFAVIKAQNEGKGVILASTWLVPVALVPRAWDVPDDD